MQQNSGVDNKGNGADSFLYYNSADFFQLVELLNDSNSVEKCLRNFFDRFTSLFAQFKLTVTVEYDDYCFDSGKSKKSDLYVLHEFTTPEGKSGSLKIGYDRSNVSDNSVFITEITAFLEKIIPVLSARLAVFGYEKLLTFNKERQKELQGINNTTEIIRKSG